MDLYVITPEGIPVTRRVHAAVLVCVKTAAIMSAVLALGPLKEEDYMRLVKGALESKDRLVLQAGCQHPWPCSGKPAVVFHDRGKIFTRRSSPAGAGGSARHHHRASAAVLSFGERFDGILPSLRMISVFLQICEHSSEVRARQEAETPPSLDH